MCLFLESKVQSATGAVILGTEIGWLKTTEHQLSCPILAAFEEEGINSTSCQLNLKFPKVRIMKL